MTHQPGLPAYDNARNFPALVWEAVELSRKHAFAQACVPEVGRLLQLLAGGAHRICELGTAYGVGAAWIAAGMPRLATLLTVELDAQRAESVARLFEGNASIEVVSGDWSLARDRGPFDLLFSDGGPKRNPGDPEKLLPMLRQGGVVVLDDYSPGVANDVSRRIWLDNDSYRALELRLTPDSAVILATR